MKQIREISEDFCSRTEDCSICQFTDNCVPIWKVSKEWWKDGTKDTWKSGFQIWLEEQVGKERGDTE